MPSVWSHRLNISWLPSLAFYERQVEFLRGLEDGGHLSAFRVESSFVSAYLGPTDHLQVGPAGASVWLIGREVDVARSQVALGQALHLLGVKSILLEFVAFQVLSSIADDYDTARRNMGSSWFGRTLGNEHGVVDFAVLLDGESPTTGSTYQVEFGVVSASEVSARLARKIGRIGTSLPEPPRTQHPLTITDPVPEVAMFSDWVWRPKAVDLVGEGTSEAIAGLLKFWADAEEQTREMSTKLEASGIGDDGQAIGKVGLAR